MPKRLAGATSPYLLQHADNPVDWWPWSAEALAEAAARDVPLLISVGYAACHWCHVMAHESFEDQQVAAVMNANFVSVKVDREERPDIDAVYMAATQAMTGQGGWPMTVFAAPDGRPFFAGTYFPPRPAHGLPSFVQLLEAIAHAWRERREEVLDSATQITAALDDMTRQLSTAAGDGSALSSGLLEAAAETLLTSYDADRGGFGGAPKFPPSMPCEFLLRYSRRTGSGAALDAVTGTLDAMARGGIFDQLAGGFARYSVDADWVVPHFEKMLYDNALLVHAYTEHHRLTDSPMSARVVEQTVDFLESSLLLPEGAWASSLDADTEGVEGSTYVWTPEELVDVLGRADGDWAAGLCWVTPSGTFEHGRSVLQLRTDPDDADRWARIRRHLLAARDQRPQPARDDKVILSWNGLAVAALADAGAWFERPEWVAAAARTADYLLAVHRDGDRWWRSSRHGRLGKPEERGRATLSDLADLANGLLGLHQATGEARWLDVAGQLVDEALVRYADSAGGFYDTADDAERLVVRPRDITDGATPAGASALVDAMVSYSALTGRTEHREVADRELARVLPALSRHPRSAGRWLTVAEAALAGPLQVAIVGPEPATLLRVARRFAPAGTVFGAGDGVDDRGLELLQLRTAVGGRTAAYVCRGFVCERPVTDPNELIAQLTR
jgi:uncharacterized protein